MSLRDQVHRDDLEEIRVAAVMTGGVSLAIWMGGVTAELNRLAQTEPSGRGDTWAALLDLVQADVNIDVVSGTSAGGINGAFLALAAVYGTDLGLLGKLWAETGGLGKLLRRPLEADPPSLMRGDDYFLPELCSAFETVLEHATSRYRRPKDAPVDLTITTSVMAGQSRRFVDDYGTEITEIDHLGNFRFVRRADTDPADDPFHQPGLAARLALAARSTASFPFAFEASYVPVGGEDGTDRLHPDMAGIADFDADRFVIDGGVLMNKPLRPTLRAIFAQPAGRQIRRVLTYVNPDPQDLDATEQPADRDQPPTLAKILADSLVTLPAAQSISREFEEIEEHNRRVRDRRLSRTDIVVALQGNATPAAQMLFEGYRRLRQRRAVADIARTLTTSLDDQPDGQPGSVPPSWTRAELVAALDGVTLPFVPQGSFDAAARLAPGWRWGVEPLDRIAAVAVDILKRAMWLAPLDDASLRARLKGHRAALHAQVTAVRDLVDAERRFWEDEAGQLPPPPQDSSQRPETLQRWAHAAVRRWPLAGPDAGGQGSTALLDAATMLTEMLVAARPELAQAVESAQRSGVPGADEEAERLAGLLAAVVPPSADDREVLRRALALEVVSLATASDAEQPEQEVELMQVSANTPNSFGGPARASEKLAGVKLHHFGAFYKKSWRVNDWIWGRLDGATRLCEAVLSPARLRQLQLTTDQALELVEQVATGGDDRADRAELARRFPAEECERELLFLSEKTRPVPPRLPVCATAIARRLHLQILREELPALAAAVAADERDGAARNTAGVAFRADYDAARSDGPIPAERVFSLFSDARIGAETFDDEVATDLFASTVSTAAAVTMSAVDSNRSGLGPARTITRMLRGLTLTLYALVYGAVSGSRFGHAAVSGALAVGGAAVAVALLSPRAAPVVGGVGVVLVLGGVALAALRARMRRFVAAVGLLALLSGAVAFFVVPRQSEFAGAGSLLMIVTFVVAVLVLGSVRERRG